MAFGNFVHMELMGESSKNRQLSIAILNYWSGFTRAISRFSMTGRSFFCGLWFSRWLSYESTVFTALLWNYGRSKLGFCQIDVGRVHQTNPVVQNGVSGCHGCSPGSWELVSNCCADVTAADRMTIPCTSYCLGTYVADTCNCWMISQINVRKPTKRPSTWMVWYV